MKSEDFEKFKKDKIQAEILENKRKVSRMTIRSKAAKTIEKISGKKEKGNKGDLLHREVLEGGFLFT